MLCCCGASFPHHFIKRGLLVPGVAKQNSHRVILRIARSCSTRNYCRVATLTAGKQNCLDLVFTASWTLPRQVVSECSSHAHSIRAQPGRSLPWYRYRSGPRFISGWRKHSQDFVLSQNPWGCPLGSNVQRRLLSVEDICIAISLAREFSAATMASRMQLVVLGVLVIILGTCDGWLASLPVGEQEPTRTFIERWIRAPIPSEHTLRLTVDNNQCPAVFVYYQNHETKGPTMFAGYPFVIQKQDVQMTSCQCSLWLISGHVAVLVTIQ